MNIQPLENRVVIKPFEEEPKRGGIIIPDEAKEKSMEGIVIAAGPGLISIEGTTITMTLKVGDKVLYSKFVGTEVTYQDNDYLIMKESEVLAILKEDVPTLMEEVEEFSPELAKEMKDIRDGKDQSE